MKTNKEIEKLKREGWYVVEGKFHSGGHFFKYMVTKPEKNGSNSPLYFERITL